MYEIINELKQINNHYKLSNAEFKRIESLNFKSYVPLIGKFSVGKSALINHLIGHKGLLKENIISQTSVISEVTHTEGGLKNPVKIIYKNGQVLQCSISEYQKLSLSVNEVEKVKFELNNRRLAIVNNLILVDIPGFDTGTDAHNFAMKYMNEAIAYMIAFSAEDLTLKTTMINILKELKLYKISIGIIITKTDKISRDVLENNFTKFKKLLSKYVDVNKIDFCFTSSNKSEIQEVAEYLEKLHIKAMRIKLNKLSQAIRSEAGNTLRYLEAYNNSFTQEELTILETQLQDQYQLATKATNAEFKELENNSLELIVNIVEDLAYGLEECEKIMLLMVYNQQNIQAQINGIIRNVIIKSIKAHIAPLIQLHITRIVNTITINMFIRDKVIVNVINKEDYTIELPPMSIATIDLIKEVCAKKYESKNAISPVLRKLLISVLQDIRYQLSISISKRVGEFKALFNQSLTTEFRMLEKAFLDINSSTINPPIHELENESEIIHDDDYYNPADGMSEIAESIIQISSADLVYCNDGLHQLASDESLSLVSSTFSKNYQEQNRLILASQHIQKIKEMCHEC
ncbi:MAG: hypothetical protein ATN31_10985 [Candidatus Epulonipiscioides saccharophilum]|nr:MAG: hypothetical protein ATN31_10985 [Epulopiscium sp. AS2M-Bin001]